MLISSKQYNKHLLRKLSILIRWYYFESLLYKYIIYYLFTFLIEVKYKSHILHNCRLIFCCRFFEIGRVCCITDWTTFGWCIAFWAFPDEHLIFWNLSAVSHQCTCHWTWTLSEASNFIIEYMIYVTFINLISIIIIFVFVSRSFLSKYFETIYSWNVC